MAETAAAAAQTVFRLENILVKNLSLEIPSSVVSPAFKREPTVKMELRNAARGLNRENYYEVTLEITLRLFSGEELQLLLETSQAGVIFLQNAEGRLREEILNINAPEMLYPYAGQLVSDLLMRAGAPRLFLPPFNFRALYEKKRAVVEEKMADETVPPKPS
ncbi:MAG: protein-export chaperone SecB [Betaproteobacteria bacterium]|nr:protein-export chaperone SecB [Betaproteobacteria bacterium]